jgi:hypothetical protein
MPTSSENDSSQRAGWPMLKTAEYRIRLSQLIIAPAPIEPKASLCYPDRHRRTDKQVALSAVRYMAAALLGVLIVAATLYLGVR